MNRSIKWRALVVLAVIVVALVYLYPTVAPRDKETNEPNLPKFWQKVLPTEMINLGLDLKGGMHVVFEVQVEEAVDAAMDRNIEEIRFTLRKDRIPLAEATRNEAGQIVLVLAKPEHLDQVNKILNSDFRFLKTVSTKTEGDQVRITLGLDPKEDERIREWAVSQSLETIRSRVDQLGVSEPDIRPQGKDRIILQLPGVEDPNKVKNLLSKTARLEFKLVDEAHSVESALRDGAPPGSELLYQTEYDPQTGREKKTPFLLRKRVQMTGEFITDARVALDQYNQPYVSLRFDSKGARLFERITGNNVKKRLAIVLDDNVYSAPVIQDRISGGRAQIEGRFNMEDARDLAIVLRAGALPASVKMLEERTVGASLGSDSIRQGITSIIVGMLLVLAFMLIYYRKSGAIADLALVFNVLLIAAALAAFRATLTLPGIAGIILTIGMSVDANVLIFERIREEVRLGKTPRAAVDGGFSKATWTILDANITTLIAAIVLFQFGTGPIRGFAVTLSVGIVSSLFTAMFVSRLVFDYLLVQKKMKHVSV